MITLSNFEYILKPVPFLRRRKLLKYSKTRSLVLKVDSDATIET